MAGTMVCGVNDSPEGLALARIAAGLAEQLGLRLVLVHVVDVPDGPHGDVRVRYEATLSKRALEAIGPGLARRIQTETRVMFGDRAELLAQVAAEEGADLIVLGSQAHGLRGRHLRCALARELEAATPTPVLLAPAVGQERNTRVGYPTSST